MIFTRTFFSSKRAPKPFVVLFQGRAGSTHLVDHLDSHPNLAAKMEIIFDPALDWPAQLELIRDALRSEPSRLIRAKGFKTKLDDVRDTIAFADFICSNQIAIIHLYRNNPVKLAISVIRAKKMREKIGDSNAKQTKHLVPAGPIELAEFNHALKRIQRYHVLREFVEELDVPRLDIAYESLLENEQATLKQVFEFLQVPFRKTISRMLKNTSDDLTETVTNLGELEAAHPELAEYFRS